MRRCKFYYSERKRKTAVIFALLALIIALTLAFFEIKIKPTIYDIAASQARKISVKKINSAIDELIEKENKSYSDFVKIIYDNSGKITGISSDTVKMNQFKTKAVDAIYASFLDRETSLVSVPVGNMTGIFLLSGYGPYINIYLSFSSDVTADFTGSFKSAGENQTLHSIMLDIQSTVLVTLPDRTVTETIETSFCVADTVIVGDVSNVIA